MQALQAVLLGGALPRRRRQKRRQDPFSLPDIEFINRYRFSKETVRTVIELVKDDLRLDRRGGGTSPELQVLAAIRCWGRREIKMDVLETNLNCKQRVSECGEIDPFTIIDIDRPIKADLQITGLEMLVSELHRVFSSDHVNIQDVQKLMLGYESDPKHWRKYAKFDRYRYTRNLVDAGNGAFNIMILCWGPGHASAIHDHADSHCFMKILSGNLQEIRYDWPDTVQPEIMKKMRNKTRRCCSESDDRLQNDTTDVIMNCQNDSCQNYGGRIDRGDETVWNDEYNPREMEVIGRTRLEVNDVCYINDALGLHRMENPSAVDGAVSLHLYCPPFDSCRVFDARTGRPATSKVTFTSKYGKREPKITEVNPISDVKVSDQSVV